jgi:DNA-binding transcriptional MerR regulator
MIIRGLAQMREQQTDGLLKIGELAKASGVSVSTVKHYISHSLLQPEKKTSANMAWYHPFNVERIKLIKRLQKEWFLPLSVIGELLSGQKTDMDIALYEAIYKMSPESEGVELTIRNAAKETGLSGSEINRLTDAGVVCTMDRQGRRIFDARNLRILKLVKQRCDAGLPFEQTLESFCIYTKALDKAARQDVDAMIRRVFLACDHSAQELATLIHVADSTLDEFIVLKREQHDIHHSSNSTRALSRYLSQLADFVAWLQDVVTGSSESWQGALEQLEALEQVRHSMDLSVGGAVCRAACEYFWLIDPATHQNSRLQIAALRLAFFELAPDMFGWERRANQVREGFEAACGMSDSGEVNHPPDKETLAFIKIVRKRIAELKESPGGEMNPLCERSD